MANGLPEGLVSTHEDAVSHIQRASHDEIEPVIRRFLKVYAANRDTLADGVGRRLENYFWRIWSSQKLLRTIGKDQIEKHFTAINEGGDIRTTPKASPRASRFLHTSEASASLLAPSLSASSTTLTPRNLDRIESDDVIDDQRASEVTPEDDASRAPKGSHRITFLQGEDQGETCTPTPSSPFAHHRGGAAAANTRRPCAEPERPPSILKRMSTEESSSASGSATGGSPPSIAISDHTLQSSSDASDIGLLGHVAASTAGSPIPKRQTTTRFNEIVSVSTPHTQGSLPRSIPRRSSGEGLPGGRKKSVIVATNTLTKRKPAIIRQRSSQTSQTKTSFSPPNFAAWREDSRDTTRSRQSPSSRPAMTPKTATAGRPEGQKCLSRSAGSEDQSVIAHNSQGRKMGIANGHAQLREASQSKRDERMRSQNRSFTNLSTLEGKSSAVTATADSFQALGLLDLGSTGPSQGRDAYRNETIPLKRPAPDVAVAQGDAPPTLPRTKSQLTLLLEKSKADQEQRNPL